MVFSDLFFLFVFIPSFAILYLIGTLIDRKWLKGNPLQNCRVRNWVLIFFSLIFYSWGEPVYVFLMLFSVFLNYLAGKAQKDSPRFRTHCQYRYHLHLQIPWVLCADTQRHRYSCQRPHHRTAHRHQFLHLPVHLLPYRCV